MLRFLGSAALIALGVVLFTTKASRAAMWRFVKCYWKPLAAFIVLTAGLAYYSLINA